MININGSEKVIRSIVWIMPWFSQILNYIQFIELDTSFKACKPYAFSIFHGIIFNSTIPFAITISYTENEELFEFLYKGFEKFQINSNILNNKQALSDMGPSIISFCFSHDININFCHRHIIERFGANSGVVFWVRKILKCKTKKEFLIIREEINKKIEVFINKKYNSAEFDLDDEPRLKELKNMLLLPEKVEQNEFAEDIIKSNYYLPRWVNWIRRDYHMPRCSNHAEGFHGNINTTLNTRGIKTFKNGFCKIIDFIVNYLQYRKETYCLSFQKKHSKKIQKVRNFLKEDSDFYLKCSNEVCDCEDQLFNLMIYGIDFPCVHTVLSKLISSEFFENFFDDFHIDFQNLIDFQMDYFGYLFQHSIFSIRCYKNEETYRKNIRYDFY